MDFICSLTGKSPSTTGFGSEGALTKGPFNALWPVVDLNNALVSAILTAMPDSPPSAGYVGPQLPRGSRHQHAGARRSGAGCGVHERDPGFLIENGYLEKVADFEFDGRTVLASRLGYRITTPFVDHFLGRLFETPDAVFTGRTAAAGEAGSGGFRGGRGQHRGSAAARGAELFRGWQREARPARRSRRCCISWPAAPGRVLASSTRGYASCSRGNRCWQATGTASGCA